MDEKTELQKDYVLCPRTLKQILPKLKSTRRWEWFLCDSLAHERKLREG